MKPMQRVTGVLAAAALVLTACGGEDDPAGSTIPESADFNDADVSFATDMIPHHAQALLMVDMAVNRDVSPELAGLLDQIRDAQAPEIEMMTDWLEDWEQPVPETGRGHGDTESDGDMGDMSGMDMPGMMSSEEMGSLESASKANFEDMWFTMMIEHHEGAIAMAETEIDDGEFADAKALAEDITQSQAAEIASMESLLGD